jgi:hypothetical protein
VTQICVVSIQVLLCILIFASFIRYTKLVIGINCCSNKDEYLPMFEKEVKHQIKARDKEDHKAQRQQMKKIIETQSKMFIK